jgi:aryl-alcohol dehydrogenase-like predicted oxidoreductase
VVELLWAADRLGLEPVACLQNQYNLLHRWTVEPELLSLCQRYGLGLTTYSPLAIGLLSGRFRRGQGPPAGSFWTRARQDEALSERGDRVVQTLAELAAERGVTPAQMAIAWILDHPEVTAPVVGTDRPEYVDDVFGALEIELTGEERAALDSVSSWEVPDRFL